MQVFLVKNKNKNVEKNWTKEKDIILKLKINNFLFGYANGYRQRGNAYTKKITENALESQLYERAIYNSVNLMGWS